MTKAEPIRSHRDGPPPKYGEVMKGSLNVVATWIAIIVTLLGAGFYVNDLNRTQQRIETELEVSVRQQEMEVEKLREAIAARDERIEAQQKFMAETKEFLVEAKGRIEELGEVAVTQARYIELQQKAIDTLQKGRAVRDGHIENQRALMAKMWEAVEEMSAIVEELRD